MNDNVLANQSPLAAPDIEEIETQRIEQAWRYAAVDNATRAGNGSVNLTPALCLRYYCHARWIVIELAVQLDHPTKGEIASRFIASS